MYFFFHSMPQLSVKKSPVDPKCCSRFIESVRIEWEVKPLATRLLSCGTSSQSGFGRKTPSLYLRLDLKETHYVLLEFLISKHLWLRGVEWLSSNLKVGSSIPSLHAEVSLSKMLNPELCLIEQQSAANRCTV